MNNDKNPTTTGNSAINSDEPRGLNESANFENAKNNYQNNEPTLNQNENTPQQKSNAVDDDISPLENGHQNAPGSNGAFPVGAFDISKD